MCKRLWTHPPWVIEPRSALRCTSHLYTIVYCAGNTLKRESSLSLSVSQMTTSVQSSSENFEEVFCDHVLTTELPADRTIEVVLLIHFQHKPHLILQKESKCPQPPMAHGIMLQFIGKLLLFCLFDGLQLSCIELTVFGGTSFTSLQDSFTLCL